MSHSFRQLLIHRRQSLTAQAALLEAVSPQHILERGFSVVKNTRGQVIRNADTLKQGQKLHITFADGETDVRVTKKAGAGASCFDLTKIKGRLKLYAIEVKLCLPFKNP